MTQAEQVKVGDRCELKGVKHRGEVKFVGVLTCVENGYWVGVQLDEPYGETDGKLNDQQFFTCPDKFGKFMRPSEIDVGDYPEIDEFASDD